MSEIKTLHEPFAKFLRARGIEFIRARSDRESTIEQGWPDFTVLSPTAPMMGIEFKTKEGKESAEQAAVRERLTGKGFKCFVVRELSTAIELVNAWGVNARVEAVAATSPNQRPVIRFWGSKGDWVFQGNKPIRRVVMADLGAYERGLALSDTTTPETI